MKRSSLLFPVALLPLVVVGLPACGGSESPSAGAQLTVEDFAFTRLENGKRVFTGDVYNPSSQPVQQARISVSLLDSNNRRIGTTTIAVSNIAAQDTTSFRKVFGGDQEVSGAKMRSLTVM